MVNLKLHSKSTELLIKLPFKSTGLLIKFPSHNYINRSNEVTDFQPISLNLSFLRNNNFRSSFSPNCYVCSYVSHTEPVWPPTWYRVKGGLSKSRTKFCFSQKSQKFKIILALASVLRLSLTSNTNERENPLIYRIIQQTTRN